MPAPFPQPPEERGPPRADADPTGDARGKLSRVVAQIGELAQERAEDGEVTLAALVERLGRDSFFALLLFPALILVSPLSALPGMTSLMGIFIALVAVQILAGRRTLWLPRWMGDRRIAAKRLAAASAYLSGPVARADRWFRPRLRALAEGPLATLPLGMVLVIALCMPLMEFVPMSGSLAGLAISFLAAGLLMRDGLLLTLGGAVSLGLPTLAWAALS
ncbi:exopolysaccharide biosynthesis protein [Pararhodobacter sp. SW119]|uniref:exopolysaccharide biosynthesis protein n=1 Tax=Pararhodobacter sp. SW119 TaxID=2780075 RepID=UPI001ADFA179|nr:exopolysaccharide biosynthesis protein [Pararhodobacter sp. SW119]